MPISEYLRDLRSYIGTKSLLMPAVDGLVYDSACRILLQKRTDNGLWGLPGGTLDPHEPPALSLVREVWEETGLKVAPTRLFGVFGGVGAFHIRYPHGDELDAVPMVFECRVVGGELGNRDGEATDVRFFALEEVPDELVSITRYLLEALKQGKAFDWDERWLEQLSPT